MTAAFITFEGGEGSGKSTQIKRLGEALKRAGLPFVTTREPGGTPAAERIRELLVSGQINWDATAETLLFYAARLEHVNRLVRPSLAAGRHVICDRFADSTRVYQGIGKGLTDAFILGLHKQVLGDFGPALTLVFDIDPQAGLERTSARKNNEIRFESLGLDFHRKVREGFLAIARAEPKRCVIIDAAKDEESVYLAVLAALRERVGITI